MSSCVTTHAPMVGVDPVATPGFYGMVARMKVWHVLVMLVMIMRYVRWLPAKRALLFSLIFFTITGCSRDANHIVHGVRQPLLRILLNA